MLCGVMHQSVYGSLHSDHRFQNAYWASSGKFILTTYFYFSSTVKSIFAGFSYRCALRVSHQARKMDEMGLLLLFSRDDDKSLRPDGRFRGVRLQHNACDFLLHLICLLELKLSADVF